MGQDFSRTLASSVSRYDAQAGGEAPAGLSLWEGVPDEIRWLVQAQGFQDILKSLQGKAQ